MGISITSEDGGGDVKNMTQAKSSLLVVLSEKLAGVLARFPTLRPSETAI